MKYDGMARKQFKQHARQNIREMFWPTMGASLLFLLPQVLISIIYYLSSGDDPTQIGVSGVILVLVEILVLLPLQYGLWRFMAARAHGQAASSSLVFGVFSDSRLFFNAIKLPFCIFFRSLGWCVLLIVIVILTAAVSTSSVALAVILAIVTGLCSIFVNAKIRSYDGAYVLLAEHPEMGVWESTGASAKRFRGHLFELIVFDLSFLLWGLLSVITLGIVGIYLEAYTSIAFVHYFDHLD